MARLNCCPFVSATGCGRKSRPACKRTPGRICSGLRRPGGGSSSRSLSSLYRPGKLDPASDYAGIEAARSHTAALRAWLSAIESVTAFWNPSDQLVTLEEFWRIAKDAVDSAVYQPPDDRANVVHVMSVWEARQWDVANLFVCGMTDRDFPRQHPQNLLFPDSEIDRLRAAGIPLRKASDLEREEQWLFDSLRTRATRSLFLCYPRHDAAGKSAQCSRWLAEYNQPSEAARSCSSGSALSGRNSGQGWPRGRSGSPHRNGSAAREDQPDRARRTGAVPVQILRRKNTASQGCSRTRPPSG